MGVARAGRGRAVAFDVDPNVQKNFFSKCCNFYREVTPGSPSPRKPHINTGSGSNTAPFNQMPVWGVFGVFRLMKNAWGATHTQPSDGETQSTATLPEID